MRNALAAFLLAGLAAEISFEIYAYLLSPALFGLTLQPARLVATLSEAWLGLPLPAPVAFAAHSLAGAVLFPLAYLAFTRLRPTAAPWLNGLLFGVVLWAVAQGILAPLAGRAPFMEFGAYTWSSLVAHPLMMVVFALVYQQLSARRPSPVAPAPRTNAVA